MGNPVEKYRPLEHVHEVALPVESPLVEPDKGGLRVVCDVLHLMHSSRSGSRGSYSVLQTFVQNSTSSTPIVISNISNSPYGYIPLSLHCNNSSIVYTLRVQVSPNPKLCLTLFALPIVYINNKTDLYISFARVDQILSLDIPLHLLLVSFLNIKSSP